VCFLCVVPYSFIVPLPLDKNPFFVYINNNHNNNNNNNNNNNWVKKFSQVRLKLADDARPGRLI
jgi:hypothetical protein